MAAPHGRRGVQVSDPEAVAWVSSSVVAVADEEDGTVLLLDLRRLATVQPGEDRRGKGEGGAGQVRSAAHSFVMSTSVAPEVHQASTMAGLRRVPLCRRRWWGASGSAGGRPCPTRASRAWPSCPRPGTRVALVLLRLCVGSGLALTERSLQHPAHTQRQRQRRPHVRPGAAGVPQEAAADGYRPGQRLAGDELFWRGAGASISWQWHSRARFCPHQQVMFDLDEVAARAADNTSSADTAGGAGALTAWSSSTISFPPHAEACVGVCHAQALGAGARPVAEARLPCTSCSRT